MNRRYLPLLCSALAALPCFTMAQRVYAPQYNKPLDESVITGASVDESAATLTVYVSSGAATASDVNAGTDPASPLRTIDRGIEVALALMEAEDTGVRLWIGNGTYSTPEYNYTEFATGRIIRSLTLRQQQHVLIIEGESRGGVVVDGTEVVDPETIIDYGDGLYGIPWTRNFGYSRLLWPKSGGSSSDPNNYGGEIAHRIETLFINGERQRPVILEPHELRPNTFSPWVPLEDSYLGREGVHGPGTFGVSELEEDMLFFRPLPGVDPYTAELRIGVGMSFLELREKSNLVIRNLVIRGATQPYGNPRGIIANVAAQGTVIRNILIEDVEIYDHSSGDGIFIGLAEDVTLRRVIVRRGGGNGFAGTKGRNWILEDLDFSENNWRSWLGGIQRWVVAGWKILETEDILAHRYIAYANEASGFWFDTDIENGIVRELYAVGNKVFGFYNEKNFGQVLAEDSVFMNNDRYGLHQAETGNTVLRSNIIVGNGEAPIGFRVRDFWETDPASTEQRITQDIILENNTIITSFFHPIFNFEGGQRVQYVNSFVATFAGANNQYWSPSLNRNQFLTTANVNFEGWLNAIPEGQDAGSVFADPGIDPGGDGLAHFFLFENADIDGLTESDTHPAVNGFQWDEVNSRPLVDMPLGWRQNAVIEAHFLLQSAHSGNHTLVLNSNLDAAVYLSTDSSLRHVAPQPVLTSGTATVFRDWNDGGNRVTDLELEAGTPYHVVIQAVAPAGLQVPFLSLGWNTPDMLDGEFRPVAAPFIRSPHQLPTQVPGALAQATRTINDARDLAGFGPFHPLDSEWIHHPLHGYLFVPANQHGPAFWGYSQLLGWTYFNPLLSGRWIYSHGLGSWVYSPGSDAEALRWYGVISGPQHGWIPIP